MKDKSTQLTVVITLSLLSIVMWAFTPLVSKSQMIAAQILSIGGFVVFRFIQQDKLNDLKSKYEESRQPATLSQSEVRKIIRRWSDQEFRENVQVDWNFADKNTKPIFENGEKKDELICVTGATSTTIIQVFVLASEEKVKEKNQVRDPDYYKNPFKYSEYWQEIKRQSRTRAVKESDANRIQFTPGIMQGGMQAQPEEQGDDEE